MKVIILILIILALVILFWNIYRVKNLQQNNVERVNGKKVTRFSSNLIKQNIGNKENYSYNFSLVLNAPVKDRVFLVKTNKWYIDIIKNKIRLVNNTNNLLVNFEENIETSKKYTLKIVKTKERVTVSLNNETQILELLEMDPVDEHEIVFGDKMLNGKIDLLNEVLFEGFSSNTSEKKLIFIGDDFFEPMIPSHRFLQNLEDNNGNVTTGILYYINFNNTIKMYAVRDDVNLSLIDIRQTELEEGEDMSKFGDEDFTNKFNNADEKELSSSKFRIEEYVPEIPTTSTTTLIPGSFFGCVLPETTFSSKTDCISKCLASDNEHCNSHRCQKLCLDCTNEKQCPWVKYDETLEGSIPDAPKIRLIPDDKKIIVDWKKPYDGGSEITNYLIILYESFNKNNGIIVNEVNNPECFNCEHVITGLQNQKMYDVAVRAVNAKGLGYLSNVETIAPDGQIEGSQISDTLLPSDSEIFKGVRKEMNEYICQEDEYYSLKDFIKNM